MQSFTVQELRKAFDAGRYSMENLPQKDADEAFREFFLQLVPPVEPAPIVEEPPVVEDPPALDVTTPGVI